MNSREQRIREAKKHEAPEIQEGGPRKKKRGGLKLKEKKEKFNSVQESMHAARRQEHAEIQNTEEIVVTPEVIDAMDIDVEEEVNMMEGIETNISKMAESKLEILSRSKMGIPDWIANPVLISSQIKESESSQTSAYKLTEALQKNLIAQKITHFFPVQEACLSVLLPTQNSTITPSDLFIRAQTGSGKTLAYIVPIVQTLSSRIIPRIRALILLPTRDLALQVKAEFDIYTNHSSLKTLLLGHATYATEVTQLSKSIDIIVATPGRLCDHIKNKTINLTDLRFIVIDEADRLLNQTYQHWLPTVLSATTSTSANSHIKTSRITGYGHGTPLQKLLFSATLTQNPMKISNLNLKNPIYICVDTTLQNQNQTPISKIDASHSLTVLPDSLIEEMYITTTKNKLAALTWILSTSYNKKTLIFTKSVAAAHRLSAFLNIHLPKHIQTTNTDPTTNTNTDPTKNTNRNMTSDGPLTQAISSSLSTTTRKSLLKQFGTQTKILISSDMLSRGIDLQVSQVINYDPPTRLATYVHRCGRTARAGKEGLAITLLEKRHVKHFKEVLRGCERSGSVKKGELGEVVEGCLVGIEESLGSLEEMVKGDDGVVEEVSVEEEEYNEYYYQN